MNFGLTFKPTLERPTEDGQYLLYNQCDGFHIAYATILPNGHFFGFWDWLRENQFTDEHYVAWAKLPDSTDLFDQFADKPRDGLSAFDVMQQRLAGAGKE